MGVREARPAALPLRVAARMPPHPPQRPTQPATGALTATWKGAPDRAPGEPLHVAHWNISGAQTHELYLLEYHAAQCFDVLTLSETKCATAEFWQDLRARTKWRVYVMSREQVANEDGHAPPASGGVAIIVANPRLLITAITRDTRGLLAVEVRRADSSALPVAVITAYLPPRGSPYAAHNTALYESLDENARRAEQVYGSNNVVVTGDFNVRLGVGKVGGRDGTAGFVVHGEDLTSTTLAKDPFLAFLSRRNLRPAAGRSEHSPAVFTSRGVTGSGQSTVDYILLNCDATRFTVHTPPPWEQYRTSCTHRPIAVTLFVDPAPRMPIPHTPPAPAPRWANPPFGDARWMLAADATVAQLLTRDAALQNARASGAWDAATPLERASTLAKSFDAAIKAAMDVALPPPAPHSNAPPVLPANTPRARAASAARTRARMVAGQRAMRLPPPLLALVRAARLARTVANNSGNEADRQHARLLSDRAATQLRAMHDSQVQARVHELEGLRRSDPKTFFQRLKSLASPEPQYNTDDTYERHVPSEPGELPAPARLLAALQEDLAAPATLPHALIPSSKLPLFITTTPHTVDTTTMMRPVTAEEVLNVLMPQKAGLPPAPCPATGLVEPECAICIDFNARRATWLGNSDLLNDVPRHPPSINLAAAYVKGDYGARHLRFPRPQNPAHITEYRNMIATCLAHIFNAILDAGMLPADMLEAHGSSLLKPTKPGVPAANPSDPRSRRILAMSLTLTKVFELVWAARTTHFALRHGQLDTRYQGAFVPLAHSAAHAYAARELLSARARLGNDTAVLLVDIAGAYPSVDFQALHVALLKMGLPRDWVDLTVGTARQRSVVLHVNGTTSAPQRAHQGLAQGSGLSPTIWNIFFGALGMYLNAQGVGVNLGREHFTVQIFADDVLVPTELNHTKLQHVVTLVETFCRGWGLTVRVGVNKTAILLAFGPPARARGSHLVPLPPVTLSTGEVVPYVRSYTYLGVPVRDDFAYGDSAMNVANRLEGLVARFFLYNVTLQHCSTVLLRQVLLTCCVGATGYALALLPKTDTTRRVLNAPLIRAARRTLGLPLWANGETAMSWARIPSGLYLMAATTAQLYLYLRHTPYQNSPAARIATITAREPSHYGRHGIPPPWIREAENFFNTWASRGVPLPTATSRATASKAAAAYARAVCHADARRSLPEDLPTGMAFASRAPIDAIPSHATAALVFAHTYPANLLGPLRVTPLSYMSGSGAVLSQTTVRLPGLGTKGLALLRLGALALSFPPFAPRGWALPDNPIGTDFSAVARGRICPLCAPDARATPYHVACVCPHPSVLAARTAVELSARTLVDQLTQLIAQSASAYDTTGNLSAAAAEVQRALARNANAPFGPFLLFRLLMSAPFHAAAIDDPVAMQREAALGRLFDVAVAPGHVLHRICNLWGVWSSRHFARLADAWRLSVDAQGQGPR